MGYVPRPMATRRMSSPARLTTATVRKKLRLLKLADKLGNVRAACNELGYSRDSYYRFLRQCEEGGEEALLPVPRAGVPNLKNRVSKRVENAAVRMALSHPEWGQVVAANVLQQRLRRLAERRQANLDTPRPRYRGAAGRGGARGGEAAPFAAALASGMDSDAVHVHRVLVPSEHTSSPRTIAPADFATILACARAGAGCAGAGSQDACENSQGSIAQVTSVKSAPLKPPASLAPLTTSDTMSGTSQSVSLNTSKPSAAAGMMRNSTIMRYLSSRSGRPSPSSHLV